MTDYELLFVLKPDFSESELDTVVEEVKDTLEKSRGEVKGREDWGKRDLAYEIKGFQKGYYFVWQISLPENDVAFLKKNLKLNENVLRFLLTKI